MSAGLCSRILSMACAQHHAALCCTVRRCLERAISRQVLPLAGGFLDLGDPPQEEVERVVAIVGEVSGLGMLGMQWGLFWGCGGRFHEIAWMGLDGWMKPLYVPGMAKVAMALLWL